MISKKLNNLKKSFGRFFAKKPSASVAPADTPSGSRFFHIKLMSVEPEFKVLIIRGEAFDDGRQCYAIHTDAGMTVHPATKRELIQLANARSPGDIPHSLLNEVSKRRAIVHRRTTPSSEFSQVDKIITRIRGLGEPVVEITIDCLPVPILETLNDNEPTALEYVA